MRPTSILALILLAPLLASPAFGAPADDPRPIVPASEILAKIERGEPVEYDGVIVVGDLDLSGLDLPTKHVNRNEEDIGEGLTDKVKVVVSLISIKDSEIRGEVNLSNAEFQNVVSFSKTNFTKDANFNRAKFSGYAGFLWVKFSGGNADFGEAKFSGSDADFVGAKFSGGDADFGGAQFSGDADFGEAKFIGVADFEWAQFIGVAGFEGTQFIGDADFEWAQFIEYANFMGAKFSSALYLTGLYFVRLTIDWSSIERPICDDVVTYLMLVQYFNDLDMFEDGDSCYYDYRKWRQKEKSFLSWSKYIDIMAWLTCGYGVRPGYTIGWSFLLITLFGIAFWTGNGIYRITSLYQKNTNEKVEKEWRFSSICCVTFSKIYNILRRIFSNPKILRKMLNALLKIRLSTIRRLPGRIWNASFVTEISFKDALYFSTMVFVSMPPHDWRPKEGWKYAVMLEDVLGWLLLALFLVTLGNVMIR